MIMVKAPYISRTISHKGLKLCYTKFDTHDDLEAPCRDCDFGFKRSKFKVARQVTTRVHNLRSVAARIAASSSSTFLEKLLGGRGQTPVFGALPPQQAIKLSVHRLFKGLPSSRPLYVARRPSKTAAIRIVEVVHPWAKRAWEGVVCAF